MKLDRYQIIEIFKVEKIADNNTGFYNIHFDKLIDKLSLSDYDKKLINTLYHNERLNTENAHLNKVAILLDNKIETFSEDFFELLFFRKHAYSSQYSEKKWNEFNESYESVKEVKKRVKVLKDLFITKKDMEYFLQNLSYKQDGYIDFWFSMKKSTKDSHLSEEMKSMIMNYGSIDKNDGQKASMLSYFKEVDLLESVYEKNKNSVYRREIENELSKFKVIESIPMNLFDDINYHSVFYRKTIPVYENALIYELSTNKKTIDKVVNVINQFLTKEIYNVNVKTTEGMYMYTLEAYSEDQLKELEDKVKKSFLHLPELLIKKEYSHLLKEDVYINEELSQFFKQYIKSADMYKAFSKKMPEQNNKEKKNKI